MVQGVSSRSLRGRRVTLTIVGEHMHSRRTPSVLKG